MKAFRLFFIFVMAVSMTIGCQPRSNPKRSIQLGRNPRNNGGYNVSVSTQTPINAQPSANTLWGQVTNFNQQAAYQLTYPILGNASYEYQLGQVTQIGLWGFAQGQGGVAIGNGGVIDGSTAEINLTIIDNKYGQMLSDGTTATEISMTISPSMIGYKGGQGVVQNGQASLYLISDYVGGIYLSGTINGQYFSGTVQFANDATGGQWMTLGQFSVPTCGFFRCQ